MVRAPARRDASSTFQFLLRDPSLDLDLAAERASDSNYWKYNRYTMTRNQPGYSARVSPNNVLHLTFPVSEAIGRNANHRNFPRQRITSLLTHHFVTLLS